MNAKTRQTLRMIIYAQAASDGGKCIYDLQNELEGTKMERGATACARAGYREKLPLIIKALQLCNNNPERIVTYCVKKTPDQNGYRSILVYFDIKLEDGRRLQVSFHNPLWKAEELLPYVNKGRTTRWRKVPDSHESAVTAARAIQ